MAPGGVGVNMERTGDPPEDTCGNLCCCSDCFCGHSAVFPALIWITDVTIVLPENLDHITEGDVLIEGGRILSVDLTASPSLRSEALLLSAGISTKSRHGRKSRPTSPKARRLRVLASMHKQGKTSTDNPSNVHHDF